MYKKVIKRIIDIIVSIIGLPFLVLVFVILAPIIFISDKGPIFYNAERLGYKGKVFKMFKFRSMKVNAEDIRNEDGSTFNSENDPRVTKIGRIIRKLSIDEVPQLLNVLKGDMSLVGPRAHLTTHYEGYDKLDEKQRRRLDVRPGITGFNQAYYRNSVDLEKKIEHDLYYVENISFVLDIKIFIQTIASVVLKRNIYVSQAKDSSKN